MAPLRSEGTAWHRAALLGAGLVARVAFAESSPVNLHLEPAVAVAVTSSSAAPVLGSAACLSVDVPAHGYKALSPEVSLLAAGFPERSYLNAGSAFGATLGIRYRLVDDRGGYRFHLGSAKGHQGNWLGNLWFSLGVGYAPAALGPLFSAATGLELSMADGVQLGPAFRVTQLGQVTSLGLGFSLSFGVPDTSSRHEPAPPSP